MADRAISCEPNVFALAEADPGGLYLEALADYPYMMSAEDVAGFLGQTPQAVTQYLREGCMQGVKAGRYWRIPKKMLIEYLYDNTNTSHKSAYNACGFEKPASVPACKRAK